MLGISALTLLFLYLVYLTGRKNCDECPHPERWLCFSVCREMANKMEAREKPKMSLLDERLSKLKYKDAIREMFSTLVDFDSIDEKDQAEMLEIIETKVNVTLEQLDAQIQTGVDNGYSVEMQLKLIKSICQIDSALKAGV